MRSSFAILMPAITFVVATMAFADASAQDNPSKATAEQLIATLKSGAPQKEKVDACRQLAQVGSKDAVPVLAALLADEKLGHMARYALEPIPDPAVDEALRSALVKLKGRPLVGVIASVGARRDKHAAPELRKLLADGDTEVAQAAARTLGRLGTPEAARALQDALASAPPVQQPALCQGLFRCATALGAEGRRAEAVAIYDRLRSLPGPHQVRSGALCAAIVARQADGVPLLTEHLRSPDYVLFTAAVRAAQQLPGPAVTSALTAALGELPAERQVVVIQTLGQRGDAAAISALMERAKAAPAPVRLAAVRTLAEFGRPVALPVLLGALGDSDRPLADGALECVAGMRGPEADAAVMAMFAGGDKSRRLIALELIGRRRMTRSAAVLLKAAEEADPTIRAAALRRLGELGGATQLPALISMLLRNQTKEELGATEQAIVRILARVDSPESYADLLIVPMAQAQPAQKITLVRLLAAAGGPKALQAVRAAVDDRAAEVQTAAIQALGVWKGPDAVPELLALARSTRDASQKTLALRAYLGCASRPVLPAEARLAICRQAAQLVKTSDEKRLLLSGLGNLDMPESVALITPYLADADVRVEAAAATTAVAELILKRPDAAQTAGALAEPLRKLTQSPVPAELVQRAKAALQQIESQTQKK